MLHLKCKIISSFLQYVFKIMWIACMQAARALTGSLQARLRPGGTPWTLPYTDLWSELPFPSSTSREQVLAYVIRVVNQPLHLAYVIRVVKEHCFYLKWKFLPFFLIGSRKIKKITFNLLLFHSDLGSYILCRKEKMATRTTSKRQKSV